MVPHLIVVGGLWFVSTKDIGYYADGSVDVGRAFHVGQVEGLMSHREGYIDPPGWGLCGSW
jgi:hypothetical protein